MSADCWRLCPACNEEREAKRALANRDLAEAYENLTDTLREDYEISTSPDGIFSVSYECSCTKCGFAFTFKRDAKVDLDNKPYKKT